MLHGGICSEVYFVCVTETGIPCLSAKHSDSSRDGSHFLDMFKMQMDVFEGIKKDLPACLWEGGVIDNTKNTKYEEVQKQTLYVLQMHSWGSQ